MPFMKSPKQKRVKKYQPRLQRTFSREFKQARVREIEEGLVTIGQIVRAYRVSETAVRNWIKKFSSAIQPGQRLVVEMESEAARTLALEKRNQELERVIGQKQLQLDVLELMILVASEELGVDIKKNFSGQSLAGSIKIDMKGTGE